MAEKVQNIVIHNVPENLLTDFDKIVVEGNFPGGRSEAFRELMRKAVSEYKNKR